MRARAYLGVRHETVKRTFRLSGATHELLVGWGMGEFFAWAATGLVTDLQAWSTGESLQQKAGRGTRVSGGPQIDPLIDRQRFFLRQRAGREIEIFLIDSGIGFRNGHAVTAVWAARQGAPYGHCIYLENHTTGAIARLPENIALIRRKARLWKVAVFGFLVTFPLALGLLGWLILQRGPAYMYQKTFLVSAAIAMTLLFVIGAVVSKLVFDYLRADDDQKIWIAADKALANARRLLIQKPVIRGYR
jgi:hypothetical protein